MFFKGRVWEGFDKDYSRQLLFTSARVVRDVAELLSFPRCKHVTIFPVAKNVTIFPVAIFLQTFHRLVNL